MQRTLRPPNFRLDALTVLVGTSLVVLAAAAWGATWYASSAMYDDRASAGVAEIDSMDGDMAQDETAATGEGMTTDAMGDSEMSSEADVRMRIGVSEQMSSWPWPATFAVFLGVWLAMMAAMMLPAASPMAQTFARSARNRYPPARASFLVALFLAGYLFVWGAFGAGVFVINELTSEAVGRWKGLLDAAPYVGGALLIAAGIYQFTWLKNLCLAKCRSPLSFIVGQWQDGALGAFWMGTKHGSYCLGCCIGLMAGLIVAGVMSIPWMITLAALIFAEKVTPWGPQIARVTAVCLVAAGVGLLLWGPDVPGIA